MEYFWFDHLMANNSDKIQPELSGLQDIVKLFDAQRVRNVPNAQQAENLIAFVHPGTTQTAWEAIANPDKNCYVVLVSSQPPLSSTAEGVYCIKHALPIIVGFLKKNLGKVESFKRSCENHIPDWSIFQLPSLSHLIALSILCQGYIAAHAELQELDTNVDIRKSLERMGWDRVPPELQKKVKEKQKDVSEVSWWQVFGDNAALRETIKSEWDEGWIDDSDVDQLVKMISTGTAIDIDNEKAVVKAYLQLSSKLGK